MFAVWPVVAAMVVTVKAAVIAPADTVTVAGTVAVETLSLERETTAPPAEAALSSVTVPVEVVPPATDAGKRLTVVSAAGGGNTVRLAVLVFDPSVADMVTVATVPTADVETLKLADVVPAATVTVAETVAAALSLERETTAPPAEAARSSVTIPVEAVPPATDAGERLTAVSAADGGNTVRLAVLVFDPSVADMVTFVAVPTADVETLKLADVVPADTVTVAGTVAAELSLERETTAPPAEAARSSVTVPVEAVPPATDAGERLMAVSAANGGNTVRLAVLVFDPSVADMLTFVAVPTADVETLKLADVVPADTVTVAGTVAAELSLERETTAPPAEAARSSVTVPVEAVPPATDAGATLREMSAAGGGGGKTVRLAVLVLDPSAAEMVTVVAVPTDDVETVKFADVIPDGTVTVAGTEAAGLSVETETAVPPTAAGPESVSVPVTEPPPWTEEGLRLSDVSVDATVAEDLPDLSNQAWPA